MLTGESQCIKWWHMLNKMAGDTMKNWPCHYHWKSSHNGMAHRPGIWYTEILHNF